LRTALIVGASRGLGRALAEEHILRGWRVIATVRDKSALEDARTTNGTLLETEVLDTTNWEQVDAFRERLGGRTLDLLFINAAIAGPHQLPIGEVPAGAFCELMLTNALAPLRLIDRFVDLVPSSGLVAIMSSEMSSIGSNDTGGWEAYRMSKTAVNMGLRSLAIRRAAEGRTYLAVEPGWVRTDMGGPNAPLSIAESIPKLTEMLERRRDSGGVAFVNYENRELPW
jgi:NAD(P)-dependent dehydrogenase (short-subunit alcohol dehydrogenase family)